MATVALDPAPIVTPTPVAASPVKLLGVNAADAAKYVLAGLACASAFLLVEQGKFEATEYVAIVVVPILALVGLKSAANTGANAANSAIAAQQSTAPTPPTPQA